MKKISKLLSAMLACVMLFGMLGAVSVSASVFPDMTDSNREEAVETLYALGIMVGDKDTGLFRPDDAIKRSEVAKIAVAALGLTSVAEGSTHTSKYPDVSKDYWGVGYINVATSQGIVIGDTDGNFRPEDTITYEEAMTILVRMIGHEPAALSKGGYSAGYLVVGSENGIDKNAKAAANAPATRSLVAQMMFNALTVDMMEQTSFGDNPEYSIVKDKTLLSSKLKTEKLTGQVVATSQTALDGGAPLKKGEVKIGDEIHSAEHVDAANLLGYRVVFYLQEDDFGEKQIILIRPEANKNSTLSVTADNFESIEDATGKKVLSYWKDKDNDKKATEADIKTDAILIYNGKYETMSNDLIDLTNAAGGIELLDIDRDNVYDVVFVTEFKNVVVEEVMPTSGKIIDKYGAPTLTLDPEDEDLDVEIKKGGELLKVADLKEWDVLSVAASSDNRIFRIYVVNNVVEGKVEELDDEGVVIGGKLYEIANNYTQSIALKDEGKFYLDVEGKIAAVDATSQISANYAYLLDAGMTSSLSEELEVRLFTKEGDTVQLKATEKIRFNGVSGTKGADVLAALKDGAGNVVAQLVTFEKNADGKIVALTTATDNSATGAIDENKFTLNLKLDDAVYKKATGKLGNVNVTKDTVIFDIPAGSTDPDEFAIRDISLFENDNTYDAIVFDMGKDYTAKAIIVTNTLYEASAEAESAIVTSITTGMNASDEIVDKLYVIENGEKKELLATSKDMLVKPSASGNVKLQKGDIIQYKTNAKGEITTFRVLFDISKKATQFEASPTEDLDIVYGKVTAKFASSMNVTVNDGAEKNIAFGNAKIYVLDETKSANGMLKAGTTGDIQKYDDADASFVFVKFFEDEVKEIIIVKQ